MVLVGDARGKVAILVDDMADTCGTIVQVECERFFFHWAYPKKLKYGKPRLGESMLT